MKQLLFLLLTLNCAAQAPVVQWVKVLGGTGGDTATRIIETTDGGFITAAYSYSNDGDLPPGGIRESGRPDLWILKYSAGGVLQWQKTFGGTATEFSSGIIKTADGGYVVTGTTFSNDGNVNGYHGVCDFWVVKLDAAGTLLWQNTYGGSGADYANDIKQTADGGFIVAGATTSADGQAYGYHPGNGWDFWVIKIGPSGILEWQKTLGGSNDDQAAAVVQATDGGYVVAGYAISSDGDITSMGNCFDAWLVKLSGTGDLQWQKTYDAGGCEQFADIAHTADGGYILAGYKSYDGMVIKTDTEGVMQWQKIIAGTSIEEFHSVQQTSDGGYLLRGNSGSADGDLAGVTGNGKAWLVKLDAEGQIAWQKKAGGTGNDYGYSATTTPDGGYLLCGTTTSEDQDFTGNHGGYGDIFIAKFMPENLSTTTIINTAQLTIYPNPAASILNIAIDNKPVSNITITDLSGKTILKQTNPALQVDVRSLAEGSYFLDVSCGNSHYHKQFIKQ